MKKTVIQTIEMLEKRLSKVFKNTPKLPERIQSLLVEYLPWICIILGMFAIFGALTLWRWAHFTDKVINNFNGSPGSKVITVPVNRTSVSVWFGVIILLVEGFLYISAYWGTKNRKKSGWHILFIITLINLVDAFITFFSHYGSLNRLSLNVLSSLIGLYFLYQIREFYSHGSKRQIKTE